MNPQKLAKTRRGAKLVPLVVAGLLISLYIGTRKPKLDIAYAQDVSGSTAVASDQRQKRAVMDATTEVFPGSTFTFWRFGPTVEQIDSYQVNRPEDTWELQDRYFSSSSKEKGTRLDLMIEEIPAHSIQDYLAVIVTDGENTGLPLENAIRHLIQDAHLRAIVVVFLTPEARRDLETKFRPLGPRFFAASPQSVEEALHKARNHVQSNTQ